MPALYIELQAHNPDGRAIQQISRLLKNGGVVVCPTDSVYAFVCDMQQKKGIEKMAALKGIKAEKADFSMLCNDFATISDYTVPFSTSIFRLLKRCIPGPFTFILNANLHVSKMTRSSKNTIGIRIPDNHIVQEIIKDLGNPLFTTSIHDDDSIIDYTSDPSILFERYAEEVDAIIDGGYGMNIPSTIVDCSGDTPEIIRQGAGIID